MMTTQPTPRPADQEDREYWTILDAIRSVPVGCGHADHVNQMFARAAARALAQVRHEDGSTTASFVSLALVLSFLLPLGAFLIRSAYALAEVL